MKEEPNKPHAANPASAIPFHAGHKRRGVADAERWAYMRSLLVILCALVQSSASAQLFGSFLSGYTPLLDGHPWPQVPLLTYTNVSGSWVHPTKPRDFPSVKLEFAKDSDFTTVSVRCPDSRT